MNNYKEIETEIDNFLSDNLEGYYLNNKCVGINCDYILTLNYDNEKNFCKTNRHTTKL